MSWTEERVETLKQMWGEGKSASQIAKELGGITRNAVIGKVHRLGLSNRTSTPKAAAPSQKAKSKPTIPTPKPERTAPTTTAIAEAPRPAHVGNATSIPPKRPIISAGQPLPPQPSMNEISEEALKNAAEVVKIAKRLNLMELTEKTCKWPVGDPATNDFWFCGLTAEAGKPYCEAHNAVAFQPTTTRRDRRK